MELSKKTTIVFSPDLHSQLERLARQKGKSLGRLVREACVEQYGLASKEEKLALVRELASLNLPVGTPEQMARETVAPAGEPLP